MPRVEFEGFSTQRAQHGRGMQNEISRLLHETRHGEREDVISITTIVEDVLFGGYDDGSLRDHGFRPREVDVWAQSIAKGRIPNGFRNLMEFQKHVVDIFCGHTP